MHRFEDGEVVFLKRLAGLHHVQNHVREPQDGRELDGAVELDDLDLPVDRRVVVARHFGVLGRDAQRPVPVFDVAVPGRHAQAALADLEVHELVYVRLGLQQHVPARHAHVRRAVFHVDGHVAGLDQKIPDAALRVFKHEPPVVLVDGGALVADAGEQPVHLIAQPALGQRNIQHDTASVIEIARP